VKPFKLAAIRLIVPLIAALAMFCTQSIPVSNGGGSEVEVVGYVNFLDDGPAPSTQVKLIPRDYDASAAGAIDDLMIDTSDAQGRYTFRNVTPGKYNVQAVQLAQRTRMLVTGLEVAGDTTVVPSAALLKPGTVRILLPGNEVREGHVTITGTDIAVLVKVGSSEIIVDSVPAGRMPEIRYLVNDTAAMTRKDVLVTPSDTTTIVNPLWKYLRRIFLNTSASGAGVEEDVHGFPVLIRLTADNFDFTQAEAKGEDIRFTTSRGAPLFHEIERWDPAAALAEVWVRVDTVRGNDSTQSITMYWGNRATSDFSNSAAVFDTAAGFQGVWHFSDGAGDPVRDATMNGYHGISPDGARPLVAEGAIGNCREFDGAADYITMPNTADSKLDFPENGYYTVSAWVHLDTLDDAPHLILSKGYEQYFLRFTYFPSNSPLWEFVEFNEPSTWQASTFPATSRQWTFLTGVRQGARQFLYCNGVIVDSATDIYPNTFSRNTSNDLLIGKFLKAVTVSTNYDSYCFFKGAIDEVRILSAAQSKNWVLLCYMNQRTDDRLVINKKLP
jgi:hypothetical protein